MRPSQIIAYIIVGLIFYAVYRSIRGLLGKGGKTMHCLDCGTTGKAKMITKGSTAIEVIAWLAFIVPGLIYSFWRLNSRKQACATCTSERIVPPESPAAIAHKKTLEIKN